MSDFFNNTLSTFLITLINHIIPSFIIIFELQQSLIIFVDDTWVPLPLLTVTFATRSSKCTVSTSKVSGKAATAHTEVTHVSDKDIGHGLL